MRKFQLKRGYRDGSVAPQDLDNGKVFNGDVIHTYSDITPFIEQMLEGGYIEEIEVVPQPRQDKLNGKFAAK